MGTFDSLIDKPVAIGMAVASGMNAQDLLDIEADSMSIELALSVVDLDMAFSDFVWQENVLCKD